VLDYQRVLFSVSVFIFGAEKARFSVQLLEALRPNPENTQFAPSESLRRH
jgi:hypothetical protein